jgi:hypothetical protein
MKRILVTILAVLYMAGATGTTIHIHYCMGKVMGAGFGHDDEEMCVKCGMTKSISKGCCKDEHKTVKTTDHQLAKASFDFTNDHVAIPCAPFYFAFTEKAAGITADDNLAQIHAPPGLWRTCPIYLQVQNFRI